MINPSFTPLHFHLSFPCHLAYLHDIGALGPFAGARPAQHEHNLRLHPQRYPVQKARHPLRQATNQTPDHKPAPPAAGVDRSGWGGLRCYINPRRPVNACQCPTIGSRGVKRHRFRYWLQGPMGFLQRRDAARSHAPSHLLFFFNAAVGWRPSPASASAPPNRTRRPAGRRGCSPVRDAHREAQRRHNDETANRETAGYSHCFLHIYAASLPPFMMHHSCIPKNGSPQRGKH